MIAADEFMEHADVFGNYYGTARTSLAEAAARGNDLLLDIDVQGAAQVRQNMPQAVTIFILPPNPDVLERRLRNRSRAEGGVEESVVQKRLATARHEIEKYHEYRYVLVNDVLERAAEELSAIVIAERSYAQSTNDGEPPRNPELARYRKLAQQCLLKNSGARLQPVLASFGLSL
jgi:guanylate kinase